jgi:hypothetical protein
MVNVSADRFGAKRVLEPRSNLRQCGGFGPGLDEQGAGIVAFVIRRQFSMAMCRMVFIM